MNFKEWFPLRMRMVLQMCKGQFHLLAKTQVASTASPLKEKLSACLMDKKSQTSYSLAQIKF